MVMATGNKILTAISVSKECELIKKNALVYSCEIEDNNLVWNTVENFDDENDFGEFIIEPIVNENKNDQGDLFEKGNNIIDTSSKIINEFDKNIEEFDIKRKSNINVDGPKLESIPSINDKMDIRKSSFNY